MRDGTRRGPRPGGEARPARRLARVGAAATALALVAGVLGGPAGATLAVQEERLAGPDRYATARVVAESTFESAPVALLAHGRSFADALSANYVSGGLGAPLFLTETGALPAGVLGALDGLGTTRVIIVGGTGVISEAVEAELLDSGLLVSRISGANRYETSRQVAATFASNAIGDLDGGRGAIVATGEGFADALAVAPLSGSARVPIVLTTFAGLHPVARAALEEHGIERVLVVGGPAAVSAGVVSEIEAMGIGVRRLAGATRQATSLAVAEYAAEELDYAMDRVLLARGDQFADALAAGTRGGWLRAPVVLVRSRDELGQPVWDHLRANVDTLTRVDVLGGTGVISDEVADDAVTAARGR